MVTAKTPKKASAAKKTKKSAPEATVSGEVSQAPEVSKSIRRMFNAVVVSDKMQKTIVVRVDRRVQHKFYKKYVLKSVKFKVHDEKNEAKTGDLVSIVETRPMSKHKRWALRSVIRRGGQAALTEII